MHEYYEKNKKKYRKGMNGFLKLISNELESITGKPYAELLEEVWNCYENDMLENFPYIGGDDVSGTRNLTGSYIFVAMGIVLKRYGVDMENIGHLMVQSYERYFMKMPWIAKKIAVYQYKNAQ